MATTQNHFGANVKGDGSPRGAAAEGDRANVVTDIATLVSDGVSPTQAHVTTANTDFTTMLLDFNNNDFNIILDTTKITTLAQYRTLAARAYLYFSGMLTGP